MNTTDLQNISISEKKQYKKCVNHVFLWVIIYNIIVVVIGGVLGSLKVPTGLESIIATLIGCFVIYISTFKKWPFEPFKTNKKMSAKDFFTFFCLICLMQIITLCFVSLFEFLGLKGISIQLPELTPVFMIYAAFIGPIAEELIYRGFCIGNLKKYGRIIAIVLSSIAFGLMHLNAAQFFIGLFMGLILGYIFIEYSIFWAIIFHILNNFVLATLPSIIFKNIPAEIIDKTEYVIFGIFAIIGIFILIQNKNKIKEWFASPGTHPEKGSLCQIFKSVWFWIFTIGCLAFIVLMMIFPDVFNSYMTNIK